MRLTREQFEAAVTERALAVLRGDAELPYEPQHVSNHMDRLAYESAEPERVYLAAWQKANARRPAVNSGMTLLEHLMAMRGPRGRRVFQPVTQRDAVVAASVAQWLGTNCGQAFLLAAEKQIAVWDARRRLIERLRWDGWKVTRRTAREAATAVAKPFEGDPRHETLVSAIVGVIDAAVRGRFDFDPVEGAQRSVFVREAQR